MSQIYSLHKEQIFFHQFQQHQKPCFEGCSFGAGQSKFLQKLFSGVGEALLQKVIPYAKRLCYLITLLVENPVILNL